MSTRSRSNYLHQASWEELYVLTGHWKSDMNFYADEIRFLSKLVDKYFMWLVKDEHLNHVQTIIRKLSGSDNTLKNTIKKIDKHMLHLEELMENAFSHDEQECRDEHEELENDISAYIRSFRQLKKEVFAVTEDVIETETEKIRHLLTRST